MISNNWIKKLPTTISLFALVVFCFLPTAKAELTGNLHVDNTFEAYISTDDNVQGILIGNGTDWPTMYSLVSPLIPGQDYYLHIRGTDQGGVAGFLGDFEITGSDHTFSNGLTTLTTNTSDWFVSRTGWNNYLNVTAYGVNGVTPWTTRTAGVDPDAQWIWSSDNNADNLNYFTTKISATATRAPIAEYRFEENSWDGSSGEVLDSTGNGYHGTVINSSILGVTSPALSGNPGTCAYVSQESGSIRITGLPLDTTVGAKTTVTFWMNWDGTNNVMPIGWNLHDLWLLDGSIGFNTWNNDVYGLSSAGLANGWQHIAVEFTNGNVLNNKIYINGEEKALSQQYGVPNNLRAFVNSEMRIGGVANSSFYDFRGSLDEVRIYQGSLTASQINTIMQERQPCPAPEPILEYRFDRCFYPATTGDVSDHQGNFDGSSNGALSSLSEGIINQSLDLREHNTRDWLAVPSGVIDGLDDFSVSLWFKTAVNKAQQEIFHALGDNTNDDELEIYLSNNNTVVVEVQNVAHSLVSSIVLTDDDWHHLALARDGQNLCLFIDGTSQGCITTASTGILSVPNANAIVIGQEQDQFGGGFSTAQNFEGLLDEFKIYNVRLSDTEFSSIYQNELAGINDDGSARDAVNCDYICSAPGTVNAVGIRIGGGGNDTQINSVTEAYAIHAAWLSAGSPASGLISSGDYFVAQSGSSTVDRIDFGGAQRTFAGTLAYPGFGAVGSQNLSHFLVHSSGTISLAAGDYTIYVESDDGFSFVMDTLSGDPVVFNKFGLSTAGASNELRFEGPTGNARTGGSFSLTQDSVFFVASIFFERDGGDFMEVSISNSIRTSAPPSGYEILSDGALSGKVTFGCPVISQINHYQIIHDGQGLTCAAETVTINACTNVYDGSCTLSDELVTLDVRATGSASVADTISFVGTGNASIAYTVAETVVLSYIPHIELMGS